MMHNPHIRRYLMAGLLVWLPVGVTIFVIKFIVELLDTTLDVLPKGWQPESLVGFNIPGIGILLSFAIVYLTGLLATNILGRRVVKYTEYLLDHVPFVRSVYRAVKQVSETLFSHTSSSFRRVLLIEYPRPGIWSVAFQTGDCGPEVQSRTGKTLISVFVPTTPNPTSGFLLMVPKEDAVQLDMSIDEALKMVISLGVVHPGVQYIPMTEDQH
jgi:uncharacterized membrane protein